MIRLDHYGALCGDCLNRAPFDQALRPRLSAPALSVAMKDGSVVLASGSPNVCPRMTKIGAVPAKFGSHCERPQLAGNVSYFNQACTIGGLEIDQSVPNGWPDDASWTLKP